MDRANARAFIPMLEALADGELECQNHNGNWQHTVDVCFTNPPDRYRRRPKRRTVFVLFDAAYEHGAIMVRDETDARSIVRRHGGKLVEVNEPD